MQITFFKQNKNQQNKMADMKAVQQSFESDFFFALVK